MVADRPSASDWRGKVRAACRVWLLPVTISLLLPASAGAALLTPSNNAYALGEAISGQPGFVVSASWVAGPSAAALGAHGAAGLWGPSSPARAGRFFPTDGPTFAVLTTGDVANADPPNDSSRKGTDNGKSERFVNDLTTLRLDINVPQVANCLVVDQVFYSEEFPEYVGSVFNDAYLAELDRNDWSYTFATNTVTAPGNFAFDTNGKQLTVNTALVSHEPTDLQYDGSTALLTSRVPVTPGPHTVYFTVFDAFDRIYDTASYTRMLWMGLRRKAAYLPG